MKSNKQGDDIMSMIPFEDHSNVIYGNSLNELYIDLLNSYGFMTNFAVQIIAPTYPAIPIEEPEEPAYGLNDFLVWARPFKEYLDEGTESSIYPLWLVLLELAKTKVRWSIVEEPSIWKRLLSLYIAHYMQKTLEAWKDEGQRQTLNPSDKENETKFELHVSDMTKNEYLSTIYGRMFWHEYETIGMYKNGIWGLHT